MNINEEIAASLHKTNVSEAVGRVMARLVIDYMLTSVDRINELREAVVTTLGPVPVGIMQEVDRTSLEGTFDALITLNNDLMQSILVQAIGPLEAEERKTLIAIRDSLVS